MTREEFELEYAKRHMKYDPRAIESKMASIERLRNNSTYSDSHIALCWEIQKVKNIRYSFDRGRAIEGINW